jgi:hypothetical protein
MPFILDFGTVSDAKTHPAEYFEQFVYGLSNDVGLADVDGLARQGDINQLPGFFPLGLYQGILKPVKRCADFFLYFVGELAGLGSLLGRELAYPAEHLCDLPLAAQILYAEIFERLEVGDLFEVCTSIYADFFELFKHQDSALCRSQRRSANRSSGRLDNGIEALRVGDGNFTEHFTVQVDIGLLAAIDKQAVPYAPLSARSTQTNNPQTSEISFAAFSVDASTHGGPNGGFFGRTIKMTRGAAMAFYCFQDSFLSVASGGAFSYSGHISFPLQLYF